MRGFLKWRAEKVTLSDFVIKGKYNMKGVIQTTYDEINEKYGLDEKQQQFLLQAKSIMETRFGRLFAEI